MVERLIRLSSLCKLFEKRGGNRAIHIKLHWCVQDYWHTFTELLFTIIIDAHELIRWLTWRWLLRCHIIKLRILLLHLLIFCHSVEVVLDRREQLRLSNKAKIVFTLYLISYPKLILL